MINREEIGRNIKVLLKGYADSRNEIEITVRNTNEATVFEAVKADETACAAQEEEPSSGRNTRI